MDHVGKKLEDVDKKVDQIHKAIVGNGKKGLTERMGVIEAKQDMLEQDIGEIPTMRQDIATLKSERKTAWSYGGRAMMIINSVIAIAAVLVAILK